MSVNKIIKAFVKHLVIDKNVLSVDNANGLSLVFELHYAAVMLSANILALLLNVSPVAIAIAKDKFHLDASKKLDTARADYISAMNHKLNIVLLENLNSLKNIRNIIMRIANNTYQNFTSKFWRPKNL